MASVGRPASATNARLLALLPASLLCVGLLAAAAVGLQMDGDFRQAAVLAVLAGLAVIAAIDSATLRAPNRLVYPLAAAATVLPLMAGLAEGAQAIAGGLAAFAGTLLVVFAGRGAMGYGDAKVAYICGALVGILNVPILGALTFVVGGAFAAAVLALRLRGRKDPVAFTPFLLFATVAVLLFWQSNSYWT